MQTRHYPEKDGRRIWLSRSERSRLLAAAEGADDDPTPRRRIALQLALHGLRTDEVVAVEPQHLRPLDGAGDADDPPHVLVIPDSKTGEPRQCPVAPDLVERIHYLHGGAQLRQDDAVVDVSKRSVRNWIGDAREVLVEDDERAADLGMHDLRRTWATDCYYSLAAAGVPIAEELTMSWGGWAHTSTGRETFRSDYLGPVPEHVTADAMDALELPA